MDCSYKTIQVFLITQCLAFTENEKEIPFHNSLTLVFVCHFHCYAHVQQELLRWQLLNLLLEYFIHCYVHGFSLVFKGKRRCEKGSSVLTTA